MAAAVQGLYLVAASGRDVCQARTKSLANPFTVHGCHPSNPFKFDLAKKKKKRVCMTKPCAPIGGGDEGEVNDAHTTDAK